MHQWRWPQIKKCKKTNPLYNSILYRNTCDQSRKKYVSKINVPYCEVWVKNCHFKGCYLAKKGGQKFRAWVDPPTPLFGQCPKENVFFLLMSSLSQFSVRQIGADNYSGYSKIINVSSRLRRCLRGASLPRKSEKSRRRRKGKKRWLSNIFLFIHR